LLSRFLCELSLVLLTLLFTDIPNAQAVQIEIVPLGVSEEERALLKSVVLASSELQAEIQSHRFRMLEVFDGNDQAPKETELQPGDLLWLGYDYDANRLVKVLMKPEQIHVSAMPSTRVQQLPSPSPEEFSEASAILEKDAFFGPLRSWWEPYEAMPGVLPATSETQGDRLITIGILPRAGAPAPLIHEIVGVNLSRRRIVRYLTGAPPTARAAAKVCAPRNAGQGSLARGVSGAAKIIVRDDNGTEIWNFQAIRPSASSGARGSGIDLRNLFYRKQKIASQIHTPIVNVQYAKNLCGPFRDWQYSENPFQAQGTSISPGFLEASGHPTTILESGRDLGNYRGIAISKEGETTRLVTEISAGWYRYQVEYLFYIDGRIEPRWGFAAIQDSCTCNLHFHHAYWRMDFDFANASETRLAKTSVRASASSDLLVLPTPGNRVEAGNGTQWRLITREQKLFRQEAESLLRISQEQSPTVVLLEPGERDGTAGQSSSFGRGDAWVLGYRPGQLEDSSLTALAPIAIDRFVGNDPVVDRDIVIWYGAHFRHDSDDDSGASHILGPTLKVLVPPVDPAAGF
jgi:hypothetical protein